MLEIPAPLLQAIHDYLMTRPMREVETLVLDIRKCAPSAPENDTLNAK
jgi:hypothetical protein